MATDVIGATAPVNIARFTTEFSRPSSGISFVRHILLPVQVYSGAAKAVKAQQGLLSGIKGHSHAGVAAGRVAPWRGGSEAGGVAKRWVGGRQEVSGAVARGPRTIFVKLFT